MNSDPSEQVAEEQWLIARRIARELDRILDGTDTRGAAVDRAAAELRLGRRQVYNLLARYRPSRRITSLLSGVQGRGKNASLAKSNR